MVLAHTVDNQRTQDVQISRDVTFESLLLMKETLDGLNSAGFHKPSPIQLHGIPLGKCGFDLTLEAKSGTGKTAVFTVIALEKIDLIKGLQVIVLAPTREIAAQICDVMKEIGSGYEGLKVEVVMGGLSVEEDIAKFKRKVHIVVGSPGRLRHLIQDGHVDVTSVRLLILDEADKLVDKSFLADINYIFSLLPEQKQVIMSSATYPENSKVFISQYIKNAQHVCPDTNSILIGIKQNITLVKHSQNIVKQTKYRLEELLKILRQHTFKQCLIFCNYQARVTELHRMLSKEQWPAEQLYGQQEQKDRLDALKTLQEYKCRILISTDLAARGIDASNVDMVINFEPPFEWQTYLHRIGRAGRFGSYGMAVTILSEGKEFTKFSEVLGTIKASLNLHYLWNDEKFTQHLDKPIEDNESKVQIKVEDKYAKVWDTISSPIEKNTEVISFEKLCISYADTNTAVESFTELVTSFENNKIMQSAEKADKYRHLDLQTIPKTYLESLSNTIKTVQEENKAKNCNELDKLANQSHSHKGHNEEFEPVVIHNMERYCNGEIKSSPQTETNQDTIEETLHSMGLPLGFGKVQGHNHKENHKAHLKAHTKQPAMDYSRKSRDTESPKVYQHKPKDNKKPVRNIITANTNPYELEESSMSSEDDGGYDTLSHEAFSQHQNFIPKKDKCRRTNKLSTNYINWYNQLKFRMKQIETMVYLDEISKL